MLGQAAAMLIPFPAPITAEVRRSAFSVRLRLSTFAGSAVTAFWDGLAVRFKVARRRFTSDWRFLARTIHASR